MKEMKFNNVNDDEWGFYIDIEKDNSLVADNYSYTNIKDKPIVKAVFSDDLSYCIDIYNFGEETDYRNYHDNTIYDECNLYNIICNFLEYYKNKFNTKNGTNLLIKVSSTTFATIALSYVLLAIL